MTTMELKTMTATSCKVFSNEICTEKTQIPTCPEKQECDSTYVKENINER